MDCALRYLGYRMRTEREMQVYLQRRGYEQEEILEVLERLKECKYIDDTAFCEEYYEQKQAVRPMGKRRLIYDLQKKGIDAATIESGLGAYTPEEEQKACAAVATRLLQRKGTDAKSLASVSRSLAGRGFSYDTIKRVMSAYLEEAGEWD